MSTRQNLQIAYDAASAARVALHRAYQADPSNSVIWDAFHAQIKIVNNLKHALIAEIVKS